MAGSSRGSPRLSGAPSFWLQKPRYSRAGEMGQVERRGVRRPLQVTQHLSMRPWKSACRFALPHAQTGNSACALGSGMVAPTNACPH